MRYIDEVLLHLRIATETINLEKSFFFIRTTNYLGIETNTGRLQVAQITAKANNVL